MANFCTDCGSRLVAAARFCTECGAPVAGSGGESPEVAPDVVEVRWEDWVEIDPFLPFMNYWREDVDEDSIPQAVLRGLARSEFEGARQRVAYHPNTPLDVLRTLALDPYLLVRAALAHNPSTPLDVFRVIAQDTDHSVRFIVAGAEGTPVEILRQLASDPEPSIREAAEESLRTRD